MRLRTILLMAMLIPLFGFAQTGDLGIFIYTEGDGDKFSCELVQDEEIYGTYDMDESGAAYIQDIPAGKYDLNLYYKKKLLVTRYDIPVLKDLSGEVNIDAEVWYYEEEEAVITYSDYAGYNEYEYDYNTDYYDDWGSSSIDAYSKPETGLHFQAGFATIEDKDYPVSGQYLFGYRVGGYPLLSKYASLGMFGGIDWSWTAFDKDTTIYPLHGNENITKERYFYWNLNYSVVIRLTAYNNKEYYSEGLFVDMGATYSLPLVFRQVAKDGNTKHITKKIHNYTDVSLFARIGIRPYTLTVNYRPFDFVQDGLPQQPTWRFGIEFLFGD